MVALYVRGVIFGITKKVGYLLNRNLFTREQHDYAQKTVGRLYECRPIDSIFSKDAVAKLKHMVETGDLRGVIKIARDESMISDKPWCVSYVISAINCFSMCLPDIVYESTTSYIYGKL